MYIFRYPAPKAQRGGVLCDCVCCINQSVKFYEAEKRNVGFLAYLSLVRVIGWWKGHGNSIQSVIMMMERECCVMTGLRGGVWDGV